VTSNLRVGFKGRGFESFNERRAEDPSWQELQIDQNFEVVFEVYISEISAYI
jgi:hypothetical protein